MQPYNKNLTNFARDLRSNQTDAEQKLWAHLRRKQLLGAQFYRQKPITGYIADFYCAAANLVIELDGSQHYEQEHKQNDVARDKAMEALGLLVCNRSFPHVIPALHFTR
jgi:very-short-patch-repair endonuclease